MAYYVAPHQQTHPAYMVGCNSAPVYHQPMVVYQDPCHKPGPQLVHQRTAGDIHVYPAYAYPGYAQPVYVPTNRGYQPVHAHPHSHAHPGHTSDGHVEVDFSMRGIGKSLHKSAKHFEKDMKHTKKEWKKTGKEFKKAGKVSKEFVLSPFIMLTFFSCFLQHFKKGVKKVF
jgi:hypothetical protein